jgi:hypothetical protein
MPSRRLNREEVIYVNYGKTELKKTLFFFACDEK